ncbi:MAG: glycosyltransferase [Deltaproteobacteria bacterium]|nr:glycosyltransferase [Deltaproteobacteria bacterium]MCL5793113.1 glycosyltransferase [Deltaproteobacteria bacterium]
MHDEDATKENLKDTQESNNPSVENILKINKMPRSLKVKFFDVVLKAGIFSIVMVFVIASIYYGSFVRLWDTTIAQGKIFIFFMYASIIYATITSLYLVFRTLLWLRYKPYILKNEPLPSVSVIIPAYNEGAFVEKSIVSAIESGYPLNKLEVICIDDGSKDDTYLYMQKAKARYPDTVKLIKHPKNMGKRHGLYNGFVNAKGSIFITMDSDSVIRKWAIQDIVTPFAKDKRIGAVAGNVKVLNKDRGLIPRMLGVSYILSFDFTRACQSTYGAVLCCPGAFSAYSGSAVKQVMEQWLNERFLNAVCTYGEDRALTNMILHKGYYTVYQNNAVIYTMVPDTYSKLAKMYIRWERSNIRESIILSTFIFKKYREKNRFLPVLNFFIVNMRYPFQYYAIVFLFIHLIFYPMNVFRYLAVVGVISLIYTIYYLRSEKDSDFIYGVLYSYFSIFLLQWIFPYAFLTLRSKSWMTR